VLALASIRACIIAIGLIAALVGLSASVLYHPVEGDEPQYLVAADLVTSGRLPYRDFFFPQMPLMAYFYSPVLALFGNVVLEARVFSALLMVGAAGMVAAGTWVVSGSRVAAAGCFVLILSNMDFLAANVVVKHYAPVSFLLAAGFLCVALGLRRGGYPAQALLAAGLALGLAVAVRANMVVVFVGVAALVVWTSPSQSRVRNLALYMAGAAPSVVVVATHALMDPLRFWVGNAEFHSAGYDIFELGWDRVKAIWGFVSTPQNGVVIGMAVLGVVSNRNAPRLPLAFLALAASAYTVLPREIYFQYLNTAVMFLASIGAIALSGLQVQRQIAFSATALLVIHLAIFSTLHLMDGGHFRAMARGDEVAWRYGERVGRSLCLATPPDALVASWKPLAAYLSGRGYYPGVEMGNWNMLYAETARLSDAEMNRLGVISRERLQHDIQLQIVDVALAEIPGLEFPESYVEHRHDLSDNPRSQIFIRKPLKDSPDLGAGCH
jgi:4-amino-4-deoxy-L-arabinose transferase-like glycosyltransferase